MKKPGEDKQTVASSRPPDKSPQPPDHNSASSIQVTSIPGQAPAPTATANGNMSLYFSYHAMAIDNPALPPGSDPSVLLCGAGGSSQHAIHSEQTRPLLLERLPEVSQILEEVQYIARRFREQDEGEAICSEWKFAAAVVDRLCLVAFSLFSIICTFTILMSAPNFIEAVFKDFT